MRLFKAANSKLQRLSGNLESIQRAQPSNFDPSRPLAFMHVPKTAGTSTAASLSKAIGPAVSCYGFDRTLFGGFTDFTSISTGSLPVAIYLSTEDMPANAGFIAGHIAYSSLRFRYPSAQLVTLLREPCQRLLSLWVFWRSIEDAPLAPWGTWGDRVRISRSHLAEFLSSTLIACQTDNVYIRMLLWPHPLIPSEEFIKPEHDEALLAEVDEVLERFAFIDILEAPDHRARLQAWLGAQLPDYRLNGTTHIPPMHRTPLHCELSAAAYNSLRERSRLDFVLWTKIGRIRMPDADLVTVRENALLQGIARYAALMAG
jgi:hypothetical protein